MQKKRLDDTCKAALLRLQKSVDSLKNKTINQFGYVDRMFIERELFELLKQLCISKMDYPLQGLGNIHREALLKKMLSLKCEENLSRAVREVFELRSFMQKITSSSAYVRDDAISSAGISQKDALRTLALHLNGFIEYCNSEFLDSVG